MFLLLFLDVMRVDIHEFQEDAPSSLWRKYLGAFLSNLSQERGCFSSHTSSVVKPQRIFMNNLFSHYVPPDDPKEVNIPGANPV
jgi:hypothetical protein